MPLNDAVFFHIKISKEIYPSFFELMSYFENPLLISTKILYNIYLVKYIEPVTLLCNIITNFESMVRLEGVT
jgi:hypothetical protein